MNIEIQETFNDLENQRDRFFSTTEFNGEIYRRKVEDKWSVGEVIYHCYLLLKLTRIASQVYLPVAGFIRSVGRFKPDFHNGEMHNIYAGQTMKAPKILEPNMKRPYFKGELRLMLEEETAKLKKLIENVNDDATYWIRYPDPVPGYPNVVQAVKLLKIHEVHHYDVVIKRERSE